MVLFTVAVVGVDVSFRDVTGFRAVGDNVGRGDDAEVVIFNSD